MSIATSKLYLLNYFTITRDPGIGYDLINDDYQTLVIRASNINVANKLAFNWAITTSNIEIKGAGLKYGSSYSDLKVGSDDYMKLKNIIERNLKEIPLIGEDIVFTY